MPRTTNNNNKNNTTIPADDTASNNNNHPCLRAYGKCNFGKKCRFAALPANCCLNFLKAAGCTSKTCKLTHMSVDGTLHPHHQQTSSKKRRVLNNNKKIETTEDDDVKNDDNTSSKECEVVEVCDLVELVEKKEEISP